MQFRPGPAVPSLGGSWIAGLLLVCLPLRGYVLHSDAVLGTGVIDPVYGTAYVGAVLTLVAAWLLVRGERETTETVTASVLGRPVRALAVGVLAVAGLVALALAFLVTVEGLSFVADHATVVPVGMVVMLVGVVLFAVALATALYVGMALLFAVVFGYLTLGRALVGAYGWPPAIVVAAVLANAIAFAPAASLVFEGILALAALGGLLLALWDPQASPTVDPVVDVAR